MAFKVCMHILRAYTGEGPLGLICNLVRKARFVFQKIEIQQEQTQSGVSCNIYAL